MADEGTESLGGVSIKVSGDFSQADQAFEAAVSRYVAAGKTLAEAISSAMAEVPSVAAAAAGAIDRVAIAAANAAANVREFGVALDATNENVAYAGENFGKLNTELDATKENVAYAGENFGKFGEQASGSMRGVVSELRLFRSAFLAIMLPEMIARVIESLVEFAQKNRESLDTAVLSWREYNGALEASNTALELTNAKLQNQIAKIEGQPQNNLKVALLEIAEAGQKMSVDWTKISILYISI